MEIQPKSKKNPYRFLVWIFLVGVGVYLIANFFKPSAKTNSELISSAPMSNSTNQPTTPPNPTIQNSKSLEEAVQNSLSGTKGNYAVVIKNLKTDESYYLNEHQVFEAGSLYKLWIMASTYKLIQLGNLKEDQILSEDVTTLNDKFDIDPDLAELNSGAITLSVQSALNQMITISHNYAALLLTEQLKLSTVAAFLQTNNFNESKVGTNGDSPTTTAYDIASFLEKLYKVELANKQYTDEMTALLKNQQLNNKLPKYLPDDVVIAHKTGELGYFSHDAGIVYTPKGDYLIIVLSKSDSPAGAEDRIALLSKAVYDYFGSKK